MLPAHLGIKGHTLLRLVSLYFWMFYPPGVWQVPGVRLAEGGGREQLHSKALGCLSSCTSQRHLVLFPFLCQVCLRDKWGEVQHGGLGCSAFLCCWKAVCICYWTGPWACSLWKNRNFLPVSWNFCKCSTVILKNHALEVFVIVPHVLWSGSSLISSSSSPCWTG